MTRIDFYITSKPEYSARQLLACRLAEKAYKMGHRVHIHTESHNQTKEMDDLLWTFRDGSFIPHDCDPVSPEHSPVTIGHESEPQGTTDVLINLAGEVPTFFSRFERVAELVDGTPENKSLGRNRFRFYRDRGYELNTHEL